MNLKWHLMLSLLFISFTNFAQEKEYNAAQVRINRFIDGTLTTPYSENDKSVPLVIFIMDSGAINRDGNDQMNRNDAFKILSKDLAKQGIASYRFDKRLFQIDRFGIKEHEITFDHFVQDTKDIIRYFQDFGNYTKIILAGHGQGALIGLLAAQESSVDGYISIAGNAQAIDQIVIQQLQKQAPGLDKSAAIAFSDLKEKGRAMNYDPALESIFGYKLQPFIKSWLKYTPMEEIKKLDIPILIIQGSKDLQVETSEAERLKEASKNATLKIIDNMNHIMREIKGGRIENHKSYNEHWLSIMPDFVSTIINFAK